MHRALPTHAADYLGPIVGGLVFILLMSLLKEPTRRNFNAIFVGGAMGAYISGGLGLWELAFAAAGSVVAFRGLQAARFIGLAWLMHSAWDLVHHFFGKPIWPFMEMSSFGCCICDVVISAWFFAGAPTLLRNAARAWLPIGGARVEEQTATSPSPSTRERSREEGPSDALTLVMVGLCVVLVVGTVFWTLAR